VARLRTQVLVYGGVTAVSQGVTFGLLALFARLLTAAEYGSYGLVTTLVTLGTAALSFGMVPAYFHFVAGHRKAIGTTFLSLVLVSGAVLVLGGLLLDDHVAPLLFGSRAEAGLVVLVLPVLALEACALLPLTQLRAQHDTRRYAATVLVKHAAVVALSVVAVGHLRTGLRGGLMALLLGSVLGTAFAFRAAPVPRARPDPALLRRMLSFGLPLQSAQLLNWALTYLDRYLIAALVSLPAVAPYTAAASLVNGVNGALMAGFSLLWPPLMYRIAEAPDAGPTFARIATRVVAFFMFVNLCLSVLARPLLELYAPAYVGAASYLPVLALAYVAYCPFLFSNSSLQLAGTTRKVTVAVLAGAAVNLVANLVLIPGFGGAGAAAATAVSFAVVTVACHLLARRHRPIRYELRPLAIVAGTAAAGFVLHALRPGLVPAAAIVVVHGLITWRVAFRPQPVVTALDPLPPVESDASAAVAGHHWTGSGRP
jgi:O-antigen/teichoic acid export membrane protein